MKLKTTNEITSVGARRMCKNFQFTSLPVSIFRESDLEVNAGIHMGFTSL